MRSSIFMDSLLLIAGPLRMGAPSSVISSDLTHTLSFKIFILTDLSSKQMISHFVGSSTRPISLADSEIISTSEATVSNWQENVKYRSPWPFW